MPAEAGDRLADAQQRVLARPACGSVPVAQLLADAEDQEQAVVGAGAEQQHDQQDLA